MIKRSMRFTWSHNKAVVGEVQETDNALCKRNGRLGTVKVARQGSCIEGLNRSSGEGINLWWWGINDSSPELGYYLFLSKLRLFPLALLVDDLPRSLERSERKCFSLCCLLKHATQV